MQQYKAIIFDFDGVILDSVDVKTNAFAAIYEPYGNQIVEKVVAHHEAHGGVSRFEKFKHYHKTFLSIEISQSQLDDLCNQFNQLVFQKVIASPYIIGAKEFIEKESKIIDLYICTGTPENEILEILNAKHLTSYFKEIYGSPKTKKEIIEIILSKYGYEKNEVLFLGDATTDYEAAMYHQLDFIGIIKEKSPFPKGTKTIHNFSTLI